MKKKKCKGCFPKCHEALLDIYMRGSHSESACLIDSRNRQKVLFYGHLSDVISMSAIGKSCHTPDLSFSMLSQYIAIMCKYQSIYHLVFCHAEKWSRDMICLFFCPLPVSSNFFKDMLHIIEEYGKFSVYNSLGNESNFIYRAPLI